VHARQVALLDNVTPFDAKRPEMTICNVRFNWKLPNHAYLPYLDGFYHRDRVLINPKVVINEGRIGRMGQTTLIVSLSIWNVCMF